MPSPVSPIQIELTVDERVELEARARAQALPHRDVIRARVVLAVANGASFAQTARDFGQQRRIVRKWAARFAEKRIRGLEEEGNRGRKARFSPGGRDAADQACLRAT